MKAIIFMFILLLFCTGISILGFYFNFKVVGVISGIFAGLCFIQVFDAIDSKM